MWATRDDVLAITGQGATDAEVAVGSSIVTVYANRTEDALPNLARRDVYWLKQATCWQTVWLRDQPGFSARSVAENYSQDGMSVTHAAEWNTSLAPMAARALKNLSWKAARTIRTTSIDIPLGFAQAAGRFTEEDSDAWSEWHPL